jgi:hypothetical protein
MGEECVELTERQWATITKAREAMGEVLKKAYPEDYARLWACAIAGSFVSTPRASYGQHELLEAKPSAKN